MLFQLFGRKISTSYVDPSGLVAYTACRLIPLDKNPGVRPIGVGEVLRRIVGKAVMRIARQDLQCAAGFFPTLCWSNWRM